MKRPPVPIGVLPAAAYVVAPNAPREVIESARVLRELYGDFIQICAGLDTSIEINKAFSIAKTVELSDGDFPTLNPVLITRDYSTLRSSSDAYLHNTAGAGVASIGIFTKGVVHGTGGYSTAGNLTINALAAQPDCTVVDATVFSIGAVVEIWDSTNRETNTIANIVGNVITMLNNLANNYFVANSGCVRKGCSLTADANFKAFSVTVADGTIFSAGDRCLISEALGANLHRKATPVIVKSIAGNVLTLFHRLPPKYLSFNDLNWQVANGAFLVTMTTVKSVSVEGLSVESDNGYPVSTRFTEDFHIQDTYPTANVLQQTINIQESLYAKVIDNRAKWGKIVLNIASHCEVNDNIVTAGTVEFCIETYHGSHYNTIGHNQTEDGASVPFKIRGYKNIVMDNTPEDNHVLNLGIELDGATENIVVGNCQPGQELTLGGYAFNNEIKSNILGSIKNIDGTAHDNRYFAEKLDLFMDVLAVSATQVVNAQTLAANPTNCAIAANPDVPRTLSWTITHPTLTAFTLTIIGVNARGQIVTEVFTEASGWNGETSNAFATVTSVVMSAMTANTVADIISIGITDVLGLSSNIDTPAGGLPEPYVYKIKKNNADALVAIAQVNATYDTYDMAVIGLAVGDDFTIWYRSNLNFIIP